MQDYQNCQQVRVAGVCEGCGVVTRVMTITERCLAAFLKCFQCTWHCSKGLKCIISLKRHNTISPTAQMGKVRYSEANKLPTATQHTGDGAGTQTNPRVFTLHLWILGRALRVSGWFLDSVLQVMRRPVKDALWSFLSNISCPTRWTWRKPSESTQAMTGAAVQAQTRRHVYASAPE